ncbi:MAG: ferric reductase-like transmembrane domain-containing protein [Pseudomonadota bacterium]
MATDTAAPVRRSGRARTILIWAGLAVAVAVPVAAASMSPQLQWRDPIYIVAGFAGVMTLPLLLLQPLLAARWLPGLKPISARRLHIALGLTLAAATLVHVGGLWITSPPDVVDALLLRSPTPFSLWGVIAMWALLGSVFLVLLRSRLRRRTWQAVHFALSLVIIAGAIAHALLIEGTMEWLSKVLICTLVALTGGFVVLPRLKQIGGRRKAKSP